jgi:hypothetical protein
MGLSFHNAVAVFQGFSGKKSAFVRTPKFNIISKTDDFSQTNYLAPRLPFSTKVEIALFFYYLTGLLIGIYTHNYIYIVVHLMLVFGFGTIAFYSWKHLSKLS